MQRRDRLLTSGVVCSITSVPRAAARHAYRALSSDRSRPEVGE